jgi:hypothetical protein
MPSERIQRRVDALLDRAEVAADARDWAEVEALAREMLGLDPTNETFKEIWDRDHEMVYRFPQVAGMTFDVQQLWVRRWRNGGPLGSSGFYYDWGVQMHEIWLDK